MPDKKTLAKGKKDAREKKKVKVKEKKRAEIEAAKKKKKVKIKVTKKKKKIKVKVIVWKKIKDRASKNVETFLQKNRLVNAKWHYPTTLLQKKSNKKWKILQRRSPSPIQRPYLIPRLSQRLNPKQTYLVLVEQWLIGPK